MNNDTNRAQLELNLKNCQSFFDLNPDGIICTDLNGQIMDANSSCLELLGYTLEELLQMQPFDLADEKEKAAIQDILCPKLKSGKVIDPIEANLIHKNGNPILVSFKSVPIVVHDELVGCYTIVKDITQQRETEQRLLESEAKYRLIAENSDKLRVAGQLAAGVAHEIRNPLTAVKGFIELMQAGVFKPHYFTVILNEIRRIESIISEFLMLAKPQGAKFKSLNLKDLLVGTVTLLNTQAIMNNVQIVFKHNSDVPDIVCDENQIKQVFINLIKNSIEAMPNGGNILVELERTASNDVKARITDQGSGIPQDRMGKLAEPFYSTKEKGTGLGLMICYKIIEEHHGQIQFQSELNKGTLVEITLPTN